MKKYKYNGLVVFIVLLFFLSGIYLFNRFSLNDALLKTGYYDSKVTIMNTADIHGHMTLEKNSWGQYTTEDINNIMGLPLVAGLISKESENNNILLFDCGDMFHGTNESNVNRGEGMVKLVNMMPYNAMAVGSNDFNFGVERFIQLSEEVSHPYVCANLYHDDERLFDSYKVFNIEGKKIGVFGLLTPDAVPKTDSYAKAHISITDPVQEANDVVHHLKQIGVDAIVLLSHLGDNNDKDLAEQVDGIDLILSARRHNLYTTPVVVNNTSIVEVGAWTTHLGKADLYFKDDKLVKITWKLLSSKDAGLQNSEMLNIANQYKEIALEASKLVVGYTNVELNGARTHMRTGETNLGNLLTDAMREVGDAEIAIINGGVVRESISVGDINQYQLGRALPFTNSLIVIEVEGSYIISALERGLRAYPNGVNGAFLHVSGLNFTFDASKPPGERVTEVLYENEPIDPDRTFIVATSDYLFYGGDNYTEFSNGNILEVKGLLKEVMADYLQIIDSNIDASIEGRIVKKGEKYKMK